MPLLSTMRAIVKPFSRWWWRRYSQPQWLVDRHGVRAGRYPGWRPRIVLSRSQCLFYRWDLRQVPAARRGKALQQQVQLHAPFAFPGAYTRWNGAQAEVWIWDQTWLLAHLPLDAQREITVIPDSILAPACDLDERKLVGLDGIEWQRWQQGALLESRHIGPLGQQSQEDETRCDLAMRTPLQPADREWASLILTGIIGLLMAITLLYQAGAALNHWWGIGQLEAQLAAQDESTAIQQQAKRRALRLRQQWLAQTQLLQVDKSGILNAVLIKMPASVNLLQQLELRPGRIELTLQDEKPDPRAYVMAFEGLQAKGFALQNVQVQPTGNGNLVRLVADIRAASHG